VGSIKGRKVTAGITEHTVGSFKGKGPVGSLEKHLLEIIVCNLIKLIYSDTFLTNNHFD